MTLFDDIKGIEITEKKLREFGLTIGVILCIIPLVVLWRRGIFHPYVFVSGLVLLPCGILCCKMLAPVYRIWMGISIIIGFFVTRLILTVLFFLVLTPAGLLMRLFKKDPLDQKIDKNVSTYWKERPEKEMPKENYELQF